MKKKEIKVFIIVMVFLLLLGIAVSASGIDDGIEGIDGGIDGVCPFCYSDNVSAGVQWADVYQSVCTITAHIPCLRVTVYYWTEVHCNDCFYSWEEIYNISIQHYSQ